ncbi:MAG: MarR family winged helix-turn-helix transcriptional regulator [Candidatus Saccharimonadales bacterium]
MSHSLPKDFYYALVSFLLQAKQQVISVASEFGLTGVQALTLLTLRHNVQRSMSDFCKLYDCDASNITGIVDGLEQKNLVSRQPHPNDRRIKIIHLEPAGVELQKQLINRIAEVSPHLFAGLTTTETHELARLIQKTQPIK